MAKNPAQQAAIAIAMKKAGKKPKSMKEGGKTLPAPFVSSPKRSIAEKLLNDKLIRQGFSAGRSDPRAPQFELFQDKETKNFIFREKPKSAKKGMKFNPKYTRGSADVGKRKQLMQQISDIYKKHRGTKAKRQKKGFPPAVAARLKRLMAQRDKI